MRFIRRFLARIRTWQWRRRPPPSVSLSGTIIWAQYMNSSTAIHREVTRNGVRIYSLCGSCGTRLNASATLCEDCAQKQSRPARPF
jgi:hypothetical protein